MNDLDRWQYPRVVPHGKQVGDLWIPADSETTNLLTSQGLIASKPYAFKRTVRDIAYGYLNRNPAESTALDVGANIGLSAVDFVSRFKSVVVFESRDHYTPVLFKNLEARSGWTLYTFRLDARVPGSATVDDFDCENVALVKFEFDLATEFVLSGAAETICQQKPIVLIEGKPNTSDPAIDYCQRELKMIVLDRYENDWILGWNEANINHARLAYYDKDTH